MVQDELCIPVNARNFFLTIKMIKICLCTEKCALAIGLAAIIHIFLDNINDALRDKRQRFLAMGQFRGQYAVGTFFVLR